MTIVAAAAIAAALSFRVVPLACTPDGLVIAGGGVLRLAPQASCAGVVAGRAIAVTLDGAMRATPVKLDLADEPASALPAGAYAFSPASPAAAEGAVVTIVIVVTVPPATPAGSDIYLSTERSGYNPSEIRMDQLDARRYRLQVPLHAGARLAFRVTRGSFSTIERDVKGRLPPPHVVTGFAGRTFTIDVAAWADDS
jgi:hypothetical protein